MEQEQYRSRVEPAEMDLLWAQGWRHFGAYFFRYSIMPRVDGLYRVLPLRIDVEEFTPSTSQKRILRRSRDIRAIFQPARIDQERERLFERHRVRFRESVPDSLTTFLSPSPADSPCPALECLIHTGERLYAVGYLDVGVSSTSAVYAMFEPAESRRSPGAQLILAEIDWVRRSGRRYLYTGYCYDRPSVYDYKKRFAGTEYYDWEMEVWRPLPEHRPRPLAGH